RPDAPLLGIPPPLPTSVPTSSPPLLLPSAIRREDRPEVTLPPRKRLGIALGPGYEVGESSSAAAARLAGGLRADYSFVATMDKEIRRDPEREIGYGITDSWDEIVETLQGAPVSTNTELGRHVTSFETRVRQDTDEVYMRLDDEQKARLSREAWRRSMDASDLARGEVMSLRTTVLAQMSKIRELHDADHRRQAVISEMLKADQRRYRGDSTTRTGDHLARAGNSIIGTGHSTTGTAGNRWSSCTTRAARGGWNKMKKLEAELWNLKVKGTDVIGYNQRFQELALLCVRMFPEESDKIERYVGGLPDMIHGNIVASKPKTMQEAVEMATELMDKKVITIAENSTPKV
ncbi:hypothetical protein Tco_0779432, partial [Tanacetum coccineum]